MSLSCCVVMSSYPLSQCIGKRHLIICNPMTHNRYQEILGYCNVCGNCDLERTGKCSKIRQLLKIIEANHV